MEIPFKSLKKDTLNKVIESFIVREGTDYGDVETSLTKKVDQVMGQLQSGSIKLLYSEKEQSINLVTKEKLNEYLNNQEEEFN